MGMRGGRVRSGRAQWPCAVAMRSEHAQSHAQSACAVGMRSGHAQWVCAVGMRSGHVQWLWRGGCALAT